MSQGFEEEDVPVLLLKDVREIFDLRAIDRLPSAEIIAALLDPADSMWSEWCGVRGDERAHKLTQPELAKMLRLFKIRSRSIWSPGPRPGATSRKGYWRRDLEAAWRSYVDGDDSGGGGTAAQPRRIAETQDA